MHIASGGKWLPMSKKRSGGRRLALGDAGSRQFASLSSGDIYLTSAGAEENFVTTAPPGNFICFGFKIGNTVFWICFPADLVNNSDDPNIPNDPNDPPGDGEV
jgi:hypothetical protein